jgi:hypothetical protein
VTIEIKALGPDDGAVLTNASNPRALALYRALGGVEAPHRSPGGVEAPHRWLGGVEAPPGMGDDMVGLDFSLES